VEAYLMASKPITTYVARQIIAQGGWSVIVQRVHDGESIAEIARALFRPDGKAINRRTVSFLLHKEAEVEAAVEKAMRDWRVISEWQRRKRRKFLRATREERVRTAWLAHTGLIHGPQQTPETPSQQHQAAVTSATSVNGSGLPTVPLCADSQATNRVRFR
jgi:hypothetical protein